MGIQGAEPGSEVPLPDARQALVLEEDDLVPKPGRLNVRELLVMQRDREVHVFDQGANGRRQRAGADPGHVSDPLRRWAAAGVGLSPIAKKVGSNYALILNVLSQSHFVMGNRQTPLLLGRSLMVSLLQWRSQLHSFRLDNVKPNSCLACSFFAPAEAVLPTYQRGALHLKP